MTGIRQAVETDDAAIIRLLLETFQHLYSGMGVEMTPERRQYLSGHGALRGFSTSFVYEDERRIVGTVTLMPPSSHSEAWIEGAWDLRLLAVDPRVQKRGIATSLIAFAEQRAKAAGANAICLHARRGVAAQARLYLASRYERDPSGDLDGPPFQEGYKKVLAF